MLVKIHLLKYVLEMVVMDIKDSKHRQGVVTHVRNGRPRLHTIIPIMVLKEIIAETLMKVIRFGAILQTQM